MNRLILLILFITAGVATSSAQTTWTLEECINYALKNNIAVQQSEAQLDIAGNNLQQSKLALLPTVNGSASNNYNFGRSIDPFTNTYAVQQIRSNNFSINGNLTIFNGFQNQNTIKQQTNNQKASKEDLQATKNTMALNVAGAFLQVVLNEEVVAINKAQVQSTQQQLDRTIKLVEAGRSAINAELDIRAQLATEKLNLVNAENQVKLAYLNLWQLMMKEPDENDKINKPNLTQNFEGLPAYSSSAIYSTFSGSSPEIKASQYRILSSQYGLKVAQGNRSPRITLNGSISTLFSESFKTYGGYTLIGSRELYRDLNGNPIYAPYQVPTTSEVTSFSKQINDNLGRFVGLSMSIPIFNGGQVTNAVRNAKSNIKVAELNRKQAENNVYKEVSTAVTQYDAAKANYQSAQENFEAQKKSFEFATSRNEAGLMNFAEFALIKNNYTRAEISLAQAKYELFFRIKTIEFYNTGTITN